MTSTRTAHLLLALATAGLALRPAPGRSTRPSGAEWQVHPVKRLGTVLGTAVNAQQWPGGGTKAEPTWIAGATYDATDDVKLHVSATRKIRVPSIDQLFNIVFDVTNLFDELYDQSCALPREGRAAVLSLRARVN